MRIWPFSRIGLTPAEEARRRDEYLAQSARASRAAREEAERLLAHSKQVNRKLKAHNASNGYGLMMEALLAKSRRGRTT